MTIHNAPPVVYPLGRSHFLRGVLLGLWLGGLLLVVFWFLTARHFDWRIGLAFLAVLAAGMAARSSWRRLPTGQLAWDGGAWRWESAGYQAGISEQDIAVIADFQSRLLLRLENRAGANLWLWLERSAFPERWLDLRRAVYSVQRSPTMMPLHDSQSPTVAASQPMPLTDIQRITP